ncbi:hypothetical protein [Cobetia marina]|uniref:hypothetical protein n=1 Tax=Cobetia marina TaxID=28258 RepID=UPI0038502F18
MADFPVKWFRSDMGGAPVLGDTAAGDFIALLKACLVTGFNVTPVASANYEAESSEVQVTLTTGHGFKAWQVIEVTGADQEVYNGQHRVTSVGSDWVRYVPDATPSVSPATGTTIEIKAAPVGGWDVVAEDVDNHRIALKRTDPRATGHVLVIENNGNEGQYPSGGEHLAMMRVCDSFTDFDTFEEACTNYWPASHNWSNKDEWHFVGDSMLFYWIDRYANSSKMSVFTAGQIESLMPGDASCFVLNGIGSGSSHEWRSNDTYYTDFGSFNYGSFRKIARSYSQLPGSVSWQTMGIGSAFGDLASYPNPQDNGFYVATGKILVTESGGIRGFMPGVLQPLQSSSVYHTQIVDNVPNLEGVPLLFLLVTKQQAYGTDEVLVAWRLDGWDK